MRLLMLTFSTAASIGFIERVTPLMATSIGQWIKEGIERRGMSQRQLAIAVGVTPSHISQVVNDLGGLSPELVNAIADALEVPRKVALQAWIDSQSGVDEEMTREPDYPNDLRTVHEDINDLPPDDLEFIKTTLQVLKEKKRRQGVIGALPEESETENEKPE